MPHLGTGEAPQFNTIGLITSSLGLWFLLNSFSNLGSSNFFNFDVAVSMFIGLVFLIIFGVS